MSYEWPHKMQKVSGKGMLGKWNSVLSEYSLVRGPHGLLLEHKLAGLLPTKHIKMEGEALRSSLLADGGLAAPGDQRQWPSCFGGETSGHPSDGGSFQSPQSSSEFCVAYKH